MNKYGGRKLSFVLTAVAIFLYSIASYVLPHLLNGIGHANRLSAGTAAATAVVLLTGGALVAHIIKFDGKTHYLIAICLNALAAGSATAVYTVGLDRPFALRDVALAALAVLIFAAVNMLIGRATDGRGTSEVVYTVASILVWLSVLALLLIWWSKDPLQNTLAAALGLLWFWSGFLLWGAFVTRDEEDDGAFRGMSFWCFGTGLAVIGIAALVLMGEGGGSACDCDSNCCEYGDKEKKK